MVTVTGTENLMMAATLAEGTTTLENAAREPEVVDLARCLSAMGARIAGAGTDAHHHRRRGRACTARRTRSCPTASRPGRSSPRSRRPAATRRSSGTQADTLDAVIDKLREAGATIDVRDDAIRVRRDGPLAAVSIRTAPYPGFPTDMQAQMLALAHARARARRSSPRRSSRTG